MCFYSGYRHNRCSHGGVRSSSFRCPARRWGLRARLCACVGSLESRVRRHGGYWPRRGRYYNPSRVVLGSHAILSQGAYLCGATHEYEGTALPLVSKPITVGSYAWVCAKASVMPGVHVHDGAILGLSSVATHDLEPVDGVYAGLPARAISVSIVAKSCEWIANRCRGSPRGRPAPDSREAEDGPVVVCRGRVLPSFVAQDEPLALLPPALFRRPRRSQHVHPRSREGLVPMESLHRCKCGDWV